MLLDKINNESVLEEWGEEEILTDKSDRNLVRSCRERMDEEYLTNQVHLGKVTGCTSRGRPREE